MRWQRYDLGGAHPTHDGQDDLSHKGAQQAHKGNARQDGKDPGRVLAGSLGKALELAAMALALVHCWACHQLCNQKLFPSGKRCAIYSVDPLSGVHLPQAMHSARHSARSSTSSAQL